MEVYPDLALLRPRDDFYRATAPGPEDVLRVIEVSDTTFAFDRGTKLGHHASAGILEYWIFDVAQQRAFVFRDPAGGAYRLMETPELGGVLSPGLLPQVRLAPGDALG